MSSIMTVLGEIPRDDLEGVTLTHEHIIFDLTCLHVKSENPNLQYLAEAPLVMENLGALRNQPFLSKDNLRMQNEEIALEEVKYFKKAGGGTIVDCTTDGIGRNLEILKKISTGSGLNIIAATGHYVEDSHPPHVKTDSKAELAKRMIYEIEQGLGGIRCGIIGEIGTSWPITSEEEKVLRAATIAQKDTGAPLNVHVAARLKPGNEILNILEDEGADLGKVVMSHTDIGITREDLEYPLSLARRGCYVEFDTFGKDFYMPNFGKEGFFFPMNDIQRILVVKSLIDEGQLSHVLLSQDVWFKMSMRKYGGPGYDHILQNIVPKFRLLGLTNEQIDTMLLENPRNMLAF
jgi:phosphotriesterase-related protein